MMELTFNLTEDRREPLKPQSLKDFELTFGNGSGVNVQSNNWVQGRLQMDNLRQAFVNIQQGKDNEPFDITGYILQFCGRTPFDGKQQSYRVIDNSSVVVDGLHGRFRYTFPAQAFAVAGTYKQAYFRLIRLSDYKCIATLEFDLSVLEDFVFADMVPSDYISPFNDILNQLLDGEKKFKADTQTLYEEAAKRLNDAVTQLTQLGTDVKTTLTTEQAALQQLIEKIKENNLFTQAEAETFKQGVIAEIDKKNAEFAKSLNSPQTERIVDSSNWACQLPEYMANNWSAVVNSIPHGEGIFNFGLITDNHYQPDNEYAYRSIDHYDWFGEATKAAKVDAVIVDGDNTNGANYDNKYAARFKEELYRSTANIVDLLEGACSNQSDIFWIKGNHDSGAWSNNALDGQKPNPNNSLTENELLQLYHCNTSRYGEVRDNTSFYFYKDYPDVKVRLIGLNSLDDDDQLDADGNYAKKDINYHSFRQPQLNWLANTALKVPSDYQVILFFHTPLDGAFSTKNGMVNSGHLQSIIQAFKNGTSISINDASSKEPINGLNVDFTEQGPGTIIG
ncbi:BppU family phage baseplate upper protein, partial [Limosilactobacillus reuteri]|uniref:BppU family phage baseplate upper protein n=1 Tax=Limosilactobacillus reuteri TaxID=1598 RepID=UPI0024B942A5